MGPLPVSSSSSAEPVAAEAPRRFEQAITWARVAGAIAVLALEPLLPTLGLPWTLLLAGYLVVWGVALHILSGRAKTIEEQDRLSWIAFGGDSVVLLLAIVTVTPDPMWPLYPLIAVLFIITASFRLGPRGTGSATAIMSAELVAVAALREAYLGLPFPLAYVGFDIVVYALTAFLTVAMLREVGALRRERYDLLARAEDVELLRRSERERDALLQRERGARTDAEMATARLEALSRVTDVALRGTTASEVLPELLDQVAAAFEADAVAVLAPDGGGYLVRAAQRMVTPAARSTLRLERGDAARAVASRQPTVVADGSASAVDALAQDPIVMSAIATLRDGGATAGLLYVGFARQRQFPQDDLALLDLIAERVASILERADLFEAERRARADAQAAEGRTRMLLRAGDALAEDIELERALERIARLAVPQLADSVAIDLIQENGTFRRVALAARDQSLEHDMWMSTSRYPRVPGGKHPQWDVIRTSQPVLFEDVDPERLERLARGPQHMRILLERGVRSWMGVPLLARGRVIGTMDFVAAESGRHFGPQDLATAEALAERVAGALERARPGDTMG